MKNVTEMMAVSILGDVLFYLGIGRRITLFNVLLCHRVLQGDILCYVHELIAAALSKCKSEYIVSLSWTRKLFSRLCNYNNCLECSNYDGGNDDL